VLAGPTVKRMRRAALSGIALLLVGCASQPQPTPIIIPGPERTVFVPGPVRTVLVPGPVRVVLVPGPAVQVPQAPQACVAALNEANRLLGVFYGLAQSLVSASSSASNILDLGAALERIVGSYDPAQTDETQFLQLAGECTRAST